MKTLSFLILLLLPSCIVGEIPKQVHTCPNGIYSVDNDPPFYTYNLNQRNNIELIFCGYPGKEDAETIQTSEYDIFMIEKAVIPSDKMEPILAFGAVDDTIIFKSATALIINDVWGGFTYEFDSKRLEFIKSFSYTPKPVHRIEYQTIVKEINSGEIQYMWPWIILDAVIQGEDGAQELFLKLPNILSLDGAAAEEYSKTIRVYEAYKKHNEE